jgi:tRNA U34 5-carboxymethylaminomethyl modifying enzyme MnmG/GidA
VRERRGREREEDCRSSTDVPLNAIGGWLLPPTLACSQNPLLSVEEENEIGLALVKKLAHKQSEISSLFSDQKMHEVRKIILESYAHPTPRITDFVLGELLYLPYYAREEQEIKKMKIYESLRIPLNFKYEKIAGLSIEMQQKLNQFRPQTIAQASLIQGVTPSAISLLIFRINQEYKEESSSLKTPLR